MPRLAMLTGVPYRALGFPLLRCIEHGAIYNSELRCVLLVPCRRRIRSLQSLAGVRRANFPCPVPDDTAGIQFVLEDADAAGLVAVDRRSVPVATSRRRNL